VHNLPGAIPLLAPAAAIRLALQTRVAANVPQRTRKHKKVRVVWTEDDVGAYDEVRRLFHERYLGKVS
jgi:hypothetical protein